MSSILKGLTESYSRDEENQQNAMDTRRSIDLSRERNVGLNEPDELPTSPAETRNGVYEYSVPKGQEKLAQDLGLQYHKGHWVSRIPFQRADFQFGRPKFHAIPAQGVAEGWVDTIKNIFKRKPRDNRTVFDRDPEAMREFERSGGYEAGLDIMGWQIGWFAAEHAQGDTMQQAFSKLYYGGGSPMPFDNRSFKLAWVAYNKHHGPQIAEQGVAEDDAGDVEQRMLIKIEKEKQRLAKLKQTDPEAYQREMSKREQSRNRMPAVSTFEQQGLAEGPAFDKWADDRAASQLHKLKPATLWEVSFDYGPHQSETVKIKARSAQEAVDKVETAAEKRGRSIMVNWARPAEQDVAEGQLDELSNNTLSSYKKKAGADATQADKRGDYARGDKRFSGIVKATKKQFANDEKNVEEGRYDSDDYYNPRMSRDYGARNLHTDSGAYDFEKNVPAGEPGGERGRPSNLKGISKALPADAFGRTTGKIPKGKPGTVHSMMRDIDEDELDENCWKGYHKEGSKELFGKTVPNCVKNESEEVDEQSNYDWSAEKEKIRSMTTTQRREYALARLAQTNDDKFAHIASKAGAGHSEIMNALTKGQQGVAEGTDDGNFYAMALERYPHLKRVDREIVINALNNAYEDYLMHYGYEGIGPDEESNMIDYAVKGLKSGIAEEQHSCPHCGGEMVSEELMNEKKDACYYKVKSRYKVWPSAYASGALVKCRKSGADSWGNGGKKNESSILEGIEQVDENLHKWFKEKWVRFGPDGKIRGDCARGDDSEGKPKCLPQSKAQNLGKKGRASAAARKRREDPNPERSGKAINVNTKKKSNEGVAEGSGITGNPGMPTPYDQGRNDAKKGRSYDNPYDQPGEEQEHSQYKKGYEQGKKQGVAEAGDTAKGQKMLAKVHNRAADRVTSKQADKDPAYARKAQQTQDRAWERLAVKEETLDEKWSQKYKDSINCSNPKGFSQKAHCQGKNK